MEEIKELEIGEYVRTESGIIDKVIDIKEAGSGIRYGGESFKDTIVILNGDCLNETRVALTDIVKHSKNIIEILEDKDIVVLEYKTPRYKERITRIFIVHKIDNYLTFENNYCSFICKVEEKKIIDKICKNIKIKEILTKEKFESECFKVEEGQDV